MWITPAPSSCTKLCSNDARTKLGHKQKQDWVRTIAESAEFPAGNYVMCMARGARSAAVFKLRAHATLAMCSFQTVPELEVLGEFGHPSFMVHDDQTDKHMSDIQ